MEGHLMAAEYELPETVKNSTPTGRLVYTLLDHAGPLGYDELTNRTGAGRTAVENAIADLRERGAVQPKPDSDNHHRRLYTTAISSDF
jgi:predicted transcriptional regulator